MGGWVMEDIVVGFVSILLQAAAAFLMGAFCGKMNGGWGNARSSMFHGACAVVAVVALLVVSGAPVANIEAAVLLIIACISVASFCAALPACRSLLNDLYALVRADLYSLGSAISIGLICATGDLAGMALGMIAIAFMAVVRGDLPVNEAAPALETRRAALTAISVISSVPSKDAARPAPRLTLAHSGPGVDQAQQLSFDFGSPQTSLLKSVA